MTGPTPLNPHKGNQKVAGQVSNLRPSRQSAEQAVIAKAAEGVTDHEMTSGWRVIVARRGERCATWYYHSNDDARHQTALRVEAERRFHMWGSAR